MQAATGTHVCDCSKSCSAAGLCATLIHVNIHWHPQCQCQWGRVCACGCHAVRVPPCMRTPATHTPVDPTLRGIGGGLWQGLCVVGALRAHAVWAYITMRPARATHQSTASELWRVDEKTALFRLCLTRPSPPHAQVHTPHMTRATYARHTTATPACGAYVCAQVCGTVCARVCARVRVRVRVVSASGVGGP